MKEILPRSWLFAEPEKRLAKISPNGKFISYAACENDNFSLVIQALEDEQKIQKSEKIYLNFDIKNYPIEEYEWAHTNEHLLYWHDEQGDENWGLYAIHIHTQKIIRLTPANTQAKIIKLSAEKPHQVALLLNNRHPGLFDVCVVDILKATLETIYQNQSYIDLYVDNLFNPKIGIKPNSDGSCQVDVIENNQTKPLTTLTQLDFLCHYMFKENRLGLNHTGNAVYFSQSTESDKAQLVKFDLIDFTRTILSENSESDCQDVIFDSKTREPIAAAFTYHIKKWQVISERFKPDLDYLNQHRPNHEFSIVSQTQDNTKWVVEYRTDLKPAEYCLYLTTTKKMHDLFFADEKFKLYDDLAKQHCLTIPSQDNLSIPAYFSVPDHVLAQKDKKTPLILWIHGGPNSRDFWGFNPIHQWLTNRGYAVLSPNFRGSTGYGRAFLEAGNGEWGGKIAQDIQICAEWVANEYEFIDKSKIAIMGRSFGGYSALMGLANYPDFYACATDWVGPTNLDHFLAHIPPYWKIVYDMLIKLVGGPEVRLKHSPDHRIHQFKKPLLKAHGAHDVQVNQSGADSFIEKLADHLPDLWYATFPDEGHRFKHQKNKIAYYALVEAFAAKYLGGALEPAQSDIEKSTLTFHQGKLSDLFVSQFTK